MKSSDDYILWLPSWYPNKYEPFNGDFIQRQALATSKFNKLVVIQFLQKGEREMIENEEIIVSKRENLLEITVIISFTPSANLFLDKLRYNWKYYRTAKRFLENFFKENGLPTHVHVHIPMKAGILALWIKRKYNIGYIVSEHSSHYMKNSSDSFFKKSRLHKKQVALVFKNANQVINVSDAIGKVLKQLFNLDKVSVIHNTVDTKLFYVQRDKEEVFTYIHVSSLKEQKNIIGMLKAFKKFSAVDKNWKLQIVGPYTDCLLQYVRNNFLENNVELIGELPYESVAHYMKRAHAFVLFSNHENFPCVIIEALCCGLPIISTDVAGVKEAINGNNGILVSMRDEDALYNALIKMKEDYIKYDPLQISAEASDKYCYQEIGQQISNLYQKLSK